MPEIDFTLIWFNLSQIGIAFLLALPIAFNREYVASGAGLRTYPLVSIACCSFMLVAMDVYQGSDAEARVMYGVITGMGFIGGGAIVKEAGRAIGTANAAGIWLTGAIGLSVAYSRYEIAIVLSIIGFLIFQFGSYLKKQDT
ncbi:MgtC/SapB family protein [Methylophaga thiooxydans]|uniref:Protein MgtC n=1 Tax=Methylophaga thiooxydans DMS010 TaxID=637616 RepID=C0N5D8_9GAMM|nr:MgtC/SapB family protein [Methylophaga thiooxydans]EEF79978.1 putative Mg2+ transporter-C family [Methylophaga thiooxydans DMS010]